MEPKEIVVKFQVSGADKLDVKFIDAQILEAKKRLFNFCNESALFMVQKNDHCFVNGRFDGTEYAVGIVVYDPNEMRKEKEVTVDTTPNEPLDEGCTSCSN